MYKIIVIVILAIMGIAGIGGYYYFTQTTKAPITLVPEPAPANGEEKSLKKLDHYLKERLLVMDQQEIIPVNVWLIEINSEYKEELKKLVARYEGFRLEGPNIFIKPGAKVSQSLLDEINKEKSKIFVQLHAKRTQPVKDFIQSVGGTLGSPVPSTPLIVAELTKEQIFKVAERDDVIFIGFSQKQEIREEYLGEGDFNFIFRFGITAKNELNTFTGTFAKDMVVDPPLTMELVLSKEELNEIKEKMVEINFFEYPDTFTVSPAPGKPLTMVTPHNSYYFKVLYNNTIKELSWDDRIINHEDVKAKKLEELIKYILEIIEDDYKNLPQPRGAYL